MRRHLAEGPEFYLEGGGMLDHCAEDRISRRALESAGTYDQWLSFIQRHIFEYKLSQSIPQERGFYFEARARTHHDWSIGRISTRKPHRVEARVRKLRV